MKAVWIIAKRELAAYFTSPVAYVFLVIFLLMTGFFTFTAGNFFERGEASLAAFFGWHPWLYLVLVPAVGMRLWSEERKTGTIEMLLTLPVTMWQAVVGKFLAAWAFIGIALLLTFPLWITVNYLGSPDNGVILAGYIGSFLMAGAFLAIGSCISACTRSQVIAFILTVVVCFLFLAAFYAIVDVARYRGPFFPLIVIGMNSIAAYCIAHLFESFINDALKRHLPAGTFNVFGPPYTIFLRGAAVLAVMWLILLWMYRRKLFLRI